MAPWVSVTVPPLAGLSDVSLPAAPNGQSRVHVTVIVEVAEPLAAATLYTPGVVDAVIVVADVVGLLTVKVDVRRPPSVVALFEPAVDPTVKYRS